MSEKKATEVESTEEYGEYRIPRDGKKDLVFTGQLLGHGTSRRYDGSNWSTRWDEYDLYRTKGGRFVLAHEYKSQWQGEGGIEEAWVEDTVEVAIAHGGFNDGYREVEMPDGIKDLLRDAGIDVVEQVE
ncbi:MAG: hypothetical protein ABIF09_11345 [Gemmatimonadota bacterium]